MLALSSEPSPLGQDEIKTEKLQELQSRCATLEAEACSLKQDLAVTRRELETLTESLHDIVFFLDQAANLCRVGGNVIGILGLVPSLSEPIPQQQWLEHFCVDDHSIITHATADLNSFCRSGNSLRVRARDQAGEYRWLEVSLHPSDTDANPHLYSGTARDITENHRYAQLMDTLDRAASRIRQPGLTKTDILQAVTDELEAIGLHSVIAFLEPDGMFRLESVSMPTSYQTALGNLMGMTVAQPLNLRQAPPVHASILTTNAQYFEITHNLLQVMLAPNKERWANALSCMIREKQGICAPIISGDIVRGILVVLSNQFNKRSTAAIAAFATQTAIALDNAELISQLADSERRYRRVFEAVSEGLILVDDKGRIASANQTACQLFGYRDCNLVGRPIIDFFDTQALATISQALRNNSSEAFQVQGSLIQETGKTLDVELEATSFTVQDRPGLLLTITDITERIQSEKALMHSEKLRALGQMAGGIAHDFNNLLHVIQGFTSLATSELEADPQTARDDLARVLQASDDAAEAVRRLQSLYRKTDDQSDFGQIDLAQTISDAVDLNAPRWKDEYQQLGRTIHINTELASLPEIRGNTSELRRVFSNLIINAVDAMPTGGSIIIQAMLENDWCIVRFSDTGCGIPLEKLEHIFEPFYTTKGQAGSGLGLTVSKRIIDRHGGTIQVSSEQGTGTTFTICLPAATSQDSDCIPASSDIVADADTHLKILVADDDPAIRTILTRFLLMRGHRVLHAGDGQEAIQALSQESFDLIITDLGMPDVSGRRVVETARELQPNVPIILSTGWGDSITPSQLREVGANALLSKPFTIEDLSRALQEAVPEA